MKIILDGNSMMSEDDFHEQILRLLNLPQWYGKNLDALWDALTGMVDRPLELVWTSSDIAEMKIPRFDEIVSLLRKVEARDREAGLKDVFTIKLEVSRSVI